LDIIVDSNRETNKEHLELNVSKVWPAMAINFFVDGKGLNLIRGLCFHSFKHPDEVFNRNKSL